MHTHNLNLENPVSSFILPTTKRFKEEMLAAITKLETTPGTLPPKKQAIYGKTLTNMKNALKDPLDVLTARENIEILSKNLSGGFFDFLIIMEDSPRGKIESVLKQFPEPRVSRWIMSEQAQQIQTLFKTQSEQENRLQITEEQQAQVTELLKKNKGLAIQIENLQQALNEKVTELEIAKGDNQTLKDKLHRIEIQYQIHTRILNPTEEKLLELKLENARLKDKHDELERELLKYRSAQDTPPVSKSLPSQQGFLSKNERKSKEIPSHMPFDSKTTSSSTPTYHN